MKRVRIILYAMSAATLWLASGPAFAQGLPQLVFTEWSSTQLTAKIGAGDVGTVLNLGDNHWNWTFDQPVASAALDNPGGIALNWSEPAPESGYNTLQLSHANQVFSFDILSDQASPLLGWAVTADGTVGFKLSLYGPLPPGQTSGQLPLLLQADVVYRDMGDGASVPDCASTIGLLGAVLGLLPFARRIRS